MLRTLHVMVASTERAAARKPAAADPAAAPSSSPQASNPSSNPSSSSTLCEPLVYYCGALKNVSNDAHNQRALVKAGALHVLCSALGTMLEHVRELHLHAASASAAPVL